MSETRDRADPFEREALIEQLLSAVERPALVCDPERRVRAWNDALAGAAAADSLASAVVGDLVDCGGTRPWVETIERRERTTERGRLTADGADVRVDCQPLTREDGAFGALVTVTHGEATAKTDQGRQSVVESDGGDSDGIDGDGAGSADGDDSGIDGGGAGSTDGTDDETVTSDDEGNERAGTIDTDEAGAFSDASDGGRGDGEWPVYEAIVHAAPDHVYATDADGRIRMMSREFERVTGIPTDDLVGEPVSRLAEYDYVDEADVRRGREALEAILSGERDQATVTTTPTVDGAAVTAENRLAPIERDGEIVGAVVVVRDVTERVRREARLRESRERLDLALESTDAGVFEWDVCADRVYWHETAAELFGLDTDVTYRPPEAFEERLHPEDREGVLAAVEEAVTGGGDLSVEYRIVRPDGAVRWMVTDGDVVFEDGEPDRLIGTVHDITERKEREQELEARGEKLRAVIQSSPDPIFVKDVDCRYRIVNDAALELTDRPREAVLGAAPEEVFGERIGSVIRERTERVLETERPHTFDETATLAGGDYALQTVRTPYYGPDGSVEGAVTVSRDLSERRRQREELERLTEIQQLIQETIGALASATTREEITRTVCERLADSTFYESAWIGGRDPSSREIDVTYAAGVSEDYLEDVTVTVDTSKHGRGPSGRAYRTGEVQVVDDVREDPAFEPWRDAARAHGYQSVAAIPLTHGSITHGILAIYADRPDAFSEREQAGFEVLGEAVGFGLGAAQNRRLLESETLLELEFELRSADATLTTLSGRRNCRFVVDYTVQSGSDGIIYYVSVDGIDPDEVVAILSEEAAVDTVRPLEGGDTPDLEMVVADPVYRRIAETGACGKRSVIEDGVRRIVVEAPIDVDVRRVSDVLEADFEDVELVAKREKDRSETSLWPARGDVGTNLTDRQRAVLRAAYYSGYYEWPRETDSEELAESLDIASTTLLQHLRKGHNRLLAALFDQ